jgi:hypothetical protein
MPEVQENKLIFLTSRQTFGKILSDFCLLLDFILSLFQLFIVRC